MKKLIIFDLDNTFYDYEKSHNHALLAVFNYQKYFLKFDDFLSEYEIHKKAVHERLKNNPSKHSKLLYFKDLFYEKLNMEEVVVLENTYWNEFINSTTINKNIVRLLSEKKEKGDIFCLLTNQNTNIQLKKINSWGLNFFSLILTSEEVGFEKPSQSFFEYADNLISNKFNNLKKDFYAVGDDYANDIKFWQDKYNAKSYLINNKKQNIELRKDYITDSTFKSFSIEEDIFYSPIEKAIKDIYKDG